MTDYNVTSEQGVTLVGAGQPRPADIRRALTVAPHLVAADGGANHCLKEGLTPSAVIGDFDSLGIAAKSLPAETTMIQVGEQETTDFEKCLTRIDAPFVVATGFSAGRVDHAMAVWSVLARRIGPPTVVIGENDLVFAPPSRLEIGLAAGTRISLFPMAPVTGRSTGLEWPIDGLTLSPMGRTGISNRAKGPISLSLDKPGCLVITPVQELDAILEALIR